MDGERQITLKEIADECGVSMMTVSRALDSRRSVAMRQATRDRVLEAVKQHGYKSNLTARRLKRQKTETITLIMEPRTMTGPRGAPDFDAHYESISWGIVKGVITEARRYNYDVKLEAMLGYDKNEEEDVIAHIKPQLTDGVYTFYSRRIIDYLREQRMPFLAVCNSYVSNEMCALSIDRSSGYAEAVEQVFNKGHRRVAFMGCDRIVSSNYNRDLLRSLLSAKGFFDEKLVFPVNSVFDVRKLLEEFSGSLPFSAVFCYNDTLADLVIRELRFLKIKVPEQVAVIGFDGNPAYRGEDRSNPASIVVPWQELAAVGTRRLIEAIERGDRRITETKTIPTFFDAGQTL
ncbi:MAG: LacI family DNA-binding transcriptional regulator [Victivallaceae bacterium]